MAVTGRSFALLPSAPGRSLALELLELLHMVCQLIRCQKEAPDIVRDVFERLLKAFRLILLVPAIVSELDVCVS